MKSKKPSIFKRAINSITKTPFRNRGGGYTASKNIREMGKWVTSKLNADEEVLADLPKIRTRARDLYKNNELARAIVQTFVTNVIGRGFKLQLGYYNKMLRHSYPQIQISRFEEELAVIEEMFAKDSDTFSISDLSKQSNER